MDAKVIEKAGLTKNEVKIYLALLELGEATAIRAAKKAELHTSRAYESLDRLKEKGLASTMTKAGKRVFRPAEPRVLLNYMEEKKNDVEKVLPELEALSKKKEKTPTATVYYGYKGVTNWFDNVIRRLEASGEILVFGATGKELTAETAQIYFKNYTRRRINKKIKMKMLFDKGSKDAGKYYEKQKLTQVRYMPKGSKTPAAINIVGNMVATLVWEDTPTLFVIESEQVKDTYGEYFKVLWTASKP